MKKKRTQHMVLLAKKGLRAKVILGLLFLLVIALPLTIFVLQQQQQSNQHAQVAPTYTYIRQAMHSFDGKTGWSRDCYVDPTSGPNFNKCTAWTVGDLSALRGVGGESYEAFSAFTYSKNGQQTLRQGLYIKGGRSATSRDCPIDGSGIRFDLCTPWSAPLDISTLRGVGNEAYSAFSGFIYTKSGQQTLRQTIYSLDGRTGWFRDCPVNAAGPDFNQCTTWGTGNDLSNIRGIGNESYTGFSGVTYTVNGQQILRQVILSSTGANRYERTCPVDPTNGINFNACTGWTAWELRGMISGVDQFSNYEEFTYTSATNLFPPPTDTRPNIVVIMTDDLDVPTMQTALDLGLMPNTRNYIISRGTTFTNSFVTNSLCCPSRATFLTGQYAHNHNTLSNIGANGGAPSFKDNDSSTIATWLHNAGYNTSFFGKYLNQYGQFDDVDKNGVINLEDAKYIPPGWDYWVGLLDPFTYTMSNYRLNDNGVYTAPGLNGGGYLTDHLTNRAVTYMQSGAVATKPFFMYVAPPVPHIEFLANENGGMVDVLQSYSDMFKFSIRPPQRYLNSLSATLPPLSSFNEVDVSDKPAWLKAIPVMSATDIANVQKQYRERLAALHAVDDMVGALGVALEGAGKLSNTVFVFTSDNGFQLGEHRLSNKMYPYEESIRVPLYVAAPGLSANQTDRMVVNTDLAPSISEFAGVTPGLQVDGRSFTPLMRNPTAAWRKRFLIEHWMASATEIGELPTFAGVRTDTTAKIDPNTTYVEYVTGEKEFYNLSLDPTQINNNPQAVSPLVPQWLSQLKTCVGSACRTIEDADPAPTLAPPQPPTGLTASCPAPGTQGTVSWNAVPGATEYALRIDDQSNGWDPNCNALAGDFCGNVTATSFSRTTIAGHTYLWWVHAIGPGGGSGAASGSFTCGANPTVTPIIPTPSRTPTPRPPTGIGQPPTLTPTRIPTARPTATNTPLPTATRTPTPTRPVPTATRIPNSPIPTARITSSVTPTNTACRTSSTSWQGVSIPSQATTFTITYSATPHAAKMDGVIGLSNGTATGYSNLAISTRFNPFGFIDARNGGAYAAANQIPYTPGTTYVFRVVVSIPSHTYTAYVRPSSSNTEIIVGQNFAFRTEQANVAQLNAVSTYSATSSHTLCDVSISSINPSQVPTATPTRIPGATAIPASPAPTATLIPGSTRIALTLLLHGIGKGGDNVNANATGNMNPLSKIRSVEVEMFDAQNRSQGVKKSSITFSPTTGYFHGVVDLGTGVQSGAYTMKIFTLQYLRRTYSGIVTLTQGQQVTIPNQVLVTGDVNKDNKIDVLDYNMILDCFSEFLPARNCADPVKKAVTDITDDGNVNQFDFNLLLRELSVQTGS